MEHSGRKLSVYAKLVNGWRRGRNAFRAEMAHYQKSHDLRQAVKEEKSRPAAYPVFSVIIANILAAVIPLLLLRHVPGEAIRPMDVVGFQMFVMIVTPLYVLPRVYRAVKFSRRWFLATVTVALAISPMFVSVAVFRLIVNLLDLTIKP